MYSVIIIACRNGMLLMFGIVLNKYFLSTI